MSTDLRHREIEDLLAVYALDVVDATEAAMVAAHLEGCPLCRAELDGYLETAAALGTTAAAEHVDAPPAGLWDRIAGSLAESVSEEGAGPAGRPAFLRQVTAGDAGPSDEGTVVGPTEPGAAPIDLSARRRRTYRWAAAAVGVAAAVAIAVLGVNLSQTNNQLDQARAALAAAGPRRGGERPAPTRAPGRPDGLAERRGAGGVRPHAGPARLPRVVVDGRPAVGRDVPAVGDVPRPADLARPDGQPPAPGRVHGRRFGDADSAGDHRRAGRRDGRADADTAGVRRRRLLAASPVARLPPDGRSCYGSAMTDTAPKTPRPLEITAGAEPIKLGSILLTVVEPRRGHEVAYNRWYERDHFYAGCMIGPVPVRRAAVRGHRRSEGAARARPVADHR